MDQKKKNFYSYQYKDVLENFNVSPKKKIYSYKKIIIIFILYIYKKKNSCNMSKLYFKFLYS